MRTMSVRRQPALRARLDRQKSLNDIETLYGLLPGVKPGRFSKGSAPPEEPVTFRDQPTTQEQFLRNNFLKKFTGFTGEDPRNVAKLKFLEYEERCRQTNISLRNLRRGDHNPRLNTILFVAQRKIADVLGNFKFDELLSLSRWGPGTTSSCKGSDTSASAKFKSRPDCTRQSLSWVRLCMPLLPSWSALLADQDYGVMVNPMISIVEGNKVTFVPKTANTHRTIAIEPHLNVFFQIGLGRMIRRRMKQRAHVNLDDQTLNQRLARLGSIDDSLATIDLEGASDTLSLELVRDLLPEQWFEVLNSFRSHTGKLDGESIHYEKFSSMGNGATFDLESLIFWALSAAVVELNDYNTFWVNVFGDDIVIPSGCYDEVVWALSQCGFAVNLKKSFSSGPFRESCGFDYFKGVNIRPVYLKKVPTDSMDWMQIANQIRLLAHRWAEYKGCDQRLLPAYRFALSRVSKPLLKYRVPYAMNGIIGANISSGLLSNFDEAMPNLAKDPGLGFEGFYTYSIQTSSVRIEKSDRSLVVSSVFSPGSTGNFIPMRDKVVYREEILFVPGDWYDLGPWISLH